MKRPTVLFVTPAWHRYKLTRLCLEQRRLVCDHLSAHGVDATCVVVADDDNLDTAREFGFETVDSPNDFLSRRFNDGYQYAGRNGFDFICPIGSDSWIDPDLLTVLPSRPQLQISRNYAIVREDATAIAHVQLKGAFGFGCFTMPTRMLKPFGYRPCEEDLKSGCDGSLFKALGRTHRMLPPQRRELGPLDIVAFRSPVQITPYERLLSRHNGVEKANPWRELGERYPRGLVRRTAFYHKERSVALTEAQDVYQAALLVAV